MEYFSVVVLHIEAVQRLDPAAQQALLRDQLHVSDLVLPTYLFLLFFIFIFYFHEPTVKRARAHTDAVLSVCQPTI